MQEVKVFIDKIKMSHKSDMAGPFNNKGDTKMNKHFTFA